MALPSNIQHMPPEAQGMYGMEHWLDRSTRDLLLSGFDRRRAVAYVVGLLEGAGAIPEPTPEGYTRDVAKAAGLRWDERLEELD